MLAVIAAAGYDHGPTIRAIPASEAMSDDQAREVAEKTALVWARERNAGHVANLRELTCPDPPDTWVSHQLRRAEAGADMPQWDVVALTGFTRGPSGWTINALGKDNGGMFTFDIGEDGRLRACAWGSVPVPDN
ncbi:hypothetical protein BVU76_14125 [Mycolicibacterium porcinum]|nr:hypothetical protein BVU76_14125 [Mycolicibacterium porcinum]